MHTLRRHWLDYDPVALAGVVLLDCVDVDGKSLSRRSGIGRGVVAPILGPAVARARRGAPRPL
jgi:hypothetical protein